MYRKDFDVWVECTEDVYSHLAERAFASIQAKRPRLAQLSLSKQASNWHKVFSIGDSELQAHGSVEVHLEVHLVTKEVGLFRKETKRGLQFSGHVACQHDFRLSKKYINLKLPKLAAMSAISSLSSLMTTTRKNLVFTAAQAPVSQLPASNSLPVKLSVS